MLSIPSFWKHCYYITNHQQCGCIPFDWCRRERISTKQVWLLNEAALSSFLWRNFMQHSLWIVTRENNGSTFIKRSNYWRSEYWSCTSYSCCSEYFPVVLLDLHTATSRWRRCDWHAHLRTWLVAQFFCAIETSKLNDESLK